MNVTIAVCTRDRAQRLDRLLQSLCLMTVPSDLLWEVLIIDNGSIDSTQDVIGSYGNRLPLRSATEHHPGISHARNRALSLAMGEFMLCTDDDCTVERNWLAAYLRAMQRYPLADIFGGPVVAKLVGPRNQLADALFAHAPSAFANFSFGEDNVRIDRNSHISKIPYGANFAARRRALPGMKFDSNLGRGGHDGTLLGGEETRFMCELLDAGHVGWLVPDARVEHWIDPDRASIDYLCRYYYAVGLQWEAVPEGPEATIVLRRVVTRLRLHLTQLNIGGQSPARLVQRVRDLSIALGALDSRFINPASRMVDASGRSVRRIKQ